MRLFPMCPACDAEYNDPANRRYHAQPISCCDCGPRLSLTDASGRSVATDAGYVETAARLIEEGRIVALKGLGGFHLLCDATNEQAVRTLRERKGRPSKPLAVMFPSLEGIRAAAEIGEAEERLIRSKERPITIVTGKKGSGAIAPSVAPGVDRIGVFLPYTPLHILLLDVLRRPVVATSANLSDAPIITDAETLRQRLGHVVDAVLDHDREIVNACDDSVVMPAGGRTLMLRLARGYAPKSLPLPFAASKKILAVGANQKNAIALAFGHHLILSPHIGDLVSLDAFEYFERTLETFKRFYTFEPDVVVCDLHPGYETTRWAEAFCGRHPDTELLQVQHHYAHALSCMAEYGLDEEVLAFCFDGTGYGEDALGHGTLWGGEVLLADPHTYERVLHLRPFRLLGGEKAVREPRRVALSLLFECYSLDEVLVMDNPTVKSFAQEEIETLHVMWHRGINAPQSSSVGRLFDAVASLTGLAHVLGYEGESGLLLEAAASASGPQEAFKCHVSGETIDWEPMLKQILQAPSAETTAAGFHEALADLIVETARRYPQKKVVLSGGVFQNRTLTERAAEKLDEAGIRYLLNRDVPINDGGIALGQLYHALYRERS
jgi:hydrogenase maturation protein HypF